MIVFKDWKLSPTLDVIARQYDNLSRTLLVVGELPEGYTWAMLVQVGDAMDVIQLGPMEGGVGVLLTDDMLAYSGYYRMQLRGTRGEEVRHTDIATSYIPPSLSGNGQWPTVPSEFTQMEQRLQELNAHPPVPGGNGFWMIWDTGRDEYVESGFPLPELTEGIGKETDPTVPDWAKQPEKPAYNAREVGAATEAYVDRAVSILNESQLFYKDRLVDPGNRNSFLVIDGVEYYRYHCSSNSFEYPIETPKPGSVTITLRYKPQYGDGTSETGIYACYADGTEDRISSAPNDVHVFTTPASKTLTKIRGNYDLENWALLDMSVMSITMAPQKFSDKVDKYQGTANAGKALVVGADGLVALVSAPSGGGNGETLIVSYIHDVPTIQATAFDASTGIFTCPGHGLLDNKDKNFYCLFMHGDTAYDAEKAPQKAHAHCLVKVTDDTFLIDGWDYANADNLQSIDVTAFRWHKTSDFELKNIPAFDEYRIVAEGKGICTSWWQFRFNNLGTPIFSAATNDPGRYAAWGRPDYKFGAADGKFQLNAVIKRYDAAHFDVYSEWRSVASDKSNHLFIDCMERYNCSSVNSFSFSFSGDNRQGISAGTTFKVYGVTNT